LHEIESLQDKRDLSLAVPAALVHIHELCEPVDQDAIDEWQAKLSIAQSSKQPSELALVLLHLFYKHIARSDLAANVLQQISTSVAIGVGYSFHVYSGMLIVETSLGKNLKQATLANAHFDKALAKNPRGLEAMLGKVMMLRRNRKNHAPAMEIVNKIIVMCPNFIPVSIERIHVFLESGSWDQTVEAAQRLLNIHPENIDAVAMLALNDFVRETESRMASTFLSNLYQVCKSLI
jgi:tetratricopeptide (TPR) repeat protein